MDGPFAEPTGDVAGIDADAVLSQVESGAESQPQGDAQAQTAQSPEPTSAEIAFAWNGKQIKAPLNDPRVTQWVSQGYDYAQKMQSFRQQQTEFEQKQKLVSDLESKYKTLEDYYSQNPDRWKYINEQYEALQRGLDPADPVAQQIQSLIESKLRPVDQFIQQVQARELQQIQQSEDQALDADIKSIQDNYKDLDWGGVDGDGKNLEYRVLEHARKIGTTSFRAAFRDFYHDNLKSLYEEQAKSSLVKERQKQTKLGLLGQSQAPKKGITDAEDFKNKSYDDLTAEALAEFGIG
jgi:hypothetical protein